MSNFNVLGMTPFLPAMDYKLSRHFYNDLGFTESGTIENATYFKISDFGFWLQDYYVEDWAGNFMMCLYVDDLDSWWQQIGSMKLEESYGEKARVLSSPHDQNGGYMMQIADPAGVLWHFRQNPDTA